MEFEIIFCTDGILRIKYGNKPMIPAKFIHDSHPKYKGDLGFWTRFWEEYTYFEEGLTVRQFLSCLEPWSEFFEELTHKNIQAFIDESKNPALVKDDDEHPLTWVSLSYITEVELNMEFEPDDDREDISSWFNKEHNAKLTGDWEIHGSYKLTGYAGGYEEQYGIDHSPMTDLANLPLILDSKQILVVSDFSAKRILGKDYQMFKEDSFGVRTLTHGSGYKTTYLQGKRYHRFREVIEGFFWWFPHDPVSREEFNESLKMSVDEIKDMEELEETEKSNVVPLFKEANDVIEGDDSDDKKIKKVVVAPGAFDSLIRQADRNTLFWEDLLEKTKGNDVVLKIGELKKAEAPENRIFSFIAPCGDISTPYKKI
jgi:hypothetical protein